MKIVTRAGVTCAAALFAVCVSASAQTSYSVTKLVSDVAGVAKFQDPNLVNAWGLSALGTNPWWVSDNGTGLSTLYDGQGNIQGLVVTIPPSATGGTTGTPTGMVANGTADFGGGPFIFDSEDGTIQLWSGAPSSVIKVDHGSASVYKGLAMAQMGSVNILYAADFRSGAVQAFDTNYNPVTLAAGAFKDPKLPAGFAPFNVQAIGGSLWVAFAKQDSAKHDEVDGAGLGFVDKFDSSGNLLLRLQHGAYMNAPWGIALAGSDFGKFAGDLMVGNFGNGVILAFDPITGKIKGALTNSSGKPIVIPGLWALAFGQGGANGLTSSLYFTAGIQAEAHGLFGFVAPQ